LFGNGPEGEEVADAEEDFGDVKRVPLGVVHIFFWAMP
jgi:hypothetical protein